MTPFTPSEPYGHGLTGCGTTAHLDTTINAADPIGDYRPIRPTMPGYEVARPDGARAWLLDEDVVVVEMPDGSGYQVIAPDLDTPVTLPVDEVYRAANGLGNLIAARLHDARQAQATRAELTCLDDPVDELLAGMVARALAGAA